MDSTEYHRNWRHRNPERVAAYKRGTWRKEAVTKEGMARRMLTVAKSRATARGVVFTISLQDVLRVWPQNNRCPVFGVSFDLSAPVAGKRTRRTYGPSLDRFNSAAGYTPDNIRIISYRANLLKNDASEEELRQILFWVSGGGR